MRTISKTSAASILNCWRHEYNGGVMITAIFDLDGTLADTIQDLADAVNNGLKLMGCPEHSLEEYRKFVGNGAVMLCKRALPDDRKQDTPLLHSLFSDYYNKHYLDSTKLYDGISDMLHTLKSAGVTMAIATNKPEGAAIMIADALMSDIPFVKVLGGSPDRPKKPDTAIIAEIAAALPDTENHVYMIGDSNVDIMTGQNCGIETIGCEWGFRGRKELEDAGADHIVSSPDEIVKIILGERK